MKSGGKPFPIPVVVAKAGPDFVIGAKSCSTQDAVSNDELQALAEIRRLRGLADGIKSRLAELKAGPERDGLNRELDALRRDALLWHERRRQATAAKHVALGHAEPPP